MLTTTAGAVMPVARRWYRQLWIQVLVAMALGILLGHFFPGLGTKMQPLGDGFIKLIRMLIAPIIFCTVVLGIAKMDDMSRVGRVADPVGVSMRCPPARPLMMRVTAAR